MTKDTDNNIAALRWRPIDAARYEDQRNILPPAAETVLGFLVGEIVSHRICRITGLVEPTFGAFARDAKGKFFEATEPLTIEEFKATAMASLSSKTLAL